MLCRISVAERGLTSIANIFRSRLSGLDDLLRAGTVPLRLRRRRYGNLPLSAPDDATADADVQLTVLTLTLPAAFSVLSTLLRSTL